MLYYSSFFPPFFICSVCLNFLQRIHIICVEKPKKPSRIWQRSADRLLVGLILDLQLPSAMLSALSICPCAWVSEVQGNESVIVPSSPGMLCSPSPRALLHVCFDIYFFLPQECIQVSPMLLELSLDIWLGPREAEKYIIPVGAKPNVVLAWLWVCCYWDRLESPLALGVAKRIPLMLISQEAGWWRILESAPLFPSCLTLGNPL